MSGRQPGTDSGAMVAWLLLDEGGNSIGPSLDSIAMASSRVLGESSDLGVLHLVEELLLVDE